jgi:hypothetical protein
MPSPVEISSVDILKLFFTALLGTISFIIIGIQFRPAIFPIPTKERIWRSALVGLMVPVSFLIFLNFADFFFTQDLFSFQFLEPLRWPLVIITLLVPVISFFQYNLLERWYGKTPDIERNDDAAK